MLCPFHCKPKPSVVSLDSPGLENIPQVPRNRAEVGVNNDARKAVSATPSVLKWSRTIFRPRSSKVSVQKVFLCPCHCKARPSGVSLESPGLENIPQVPGNQGTVGQNHDARKTVSVTLSGLKWSRAIFGPEAWRWAFKMFCSVHFNANQGDREFVYSPRDSKISHKCRQIEPKLLKITMRVRPFGLFFQS